MVKKSFKISGDFLLTVDMNLHYIHRCPVFFFHLSSHFSSMARWQRITIGQIQTELNRIVTNQWKKRPFWNDLPHFFPSFERAKKEDWENGWSVGKWGTQKIYLHYSKCVQCSMHSKHMCNIAKGEQNSIFHPPNKFPLIICVKWCYFFISLSSL